MSTIKIKKLLKERTELLEEMTTLSLLLHGSWIERYSKCSRPGCRCHTGKRHGPRRYVVININGRQHQKYIPNSFVETARRGLTQHKRVQKIIDRITHINLLLMKAGQL